MSHKEFFEGLAKKADNLSHEAMFLSEQDEDYDPFAFATMKAFNDLIEFVGENIHYSYLQNTADLLNKILDKKKLGG